MTIIRVSLKSRGKWKQQEDGTESAIDVWEVVSDTDQELISNVVTADLGEGHKVPTFNLRHPERDDAVVIARDADCIEDIPRVWLVTCEYSTKKGTFEFKPPLQQRTKGGMSSATKDVPAYFDARGIPLVNSAGDLYEGLTRKRRLRCINCVHNFKEIPNWFFELADTINSNWVTIHGKDYPPGTCMLSDIEMPPEPTRGTAKQIYWPVTYKVVIDPDAYFIILPNRGVHELIYQTRTTDTGGFKDVTFAVYEAETNPNRKRVEKRKIKTSDGEDIAHDIWLDSHGQSQKIVNFQDSEFGRGTMTAGSATLTLTSGAFDPEKHLKALLRIKGAGPKKRILSANITAIAPDGSWATLSAKAATDCDDKPVYVSGAIVNYFVLEDIADWSEVPLPNNQPPTAEQQEIDET